MAKGTIYILKNKSFNKRLKIGKTKRHILYRIDELNGTNLPNDYQAVALFEVADIDKAETVVFKLFREYRFNREREFFDISEKDAVLHVGAALGVKPHYLCKSLRKDFTSKDSVEDRPRVRQPVATLSKPLLRQPSTPTNASKRPTPLDAGNARAIAFEIVKILRNPKELRVKKNSQGRYVIAMGSIHIIRIASYQKKSKVYLRSSGSSTRGVSCAGWYYIPFDVERKSDLAPICRSIKKEWLESITK